MSKTACGASIACRCRVDWCLQACNFSADQAVASKSAPRRCAGPCMTCSCPFLATCHCPALTPAPLLSPGPRLHSNFSPTEVEILRTQFHSRRLSHASGRALTDIEALELEEEWLEQNGNGTPASLGSGGGLREGSRRLDRVMDEVSEGTQADMLLGLVMGFVFGIIMLFWIWERGIPRRQKLGILCGIACNLTVPVCPSPPLCHARLDACRWSQVLLHPL